MHPGGSFHAIASGMDLTPGGLDQDMIMNTVTELHYTILPTETVDTTHQMPPLTMEV